MTSLDRPVTGGSRRRTTNRKCTTTKEDCMETQTHETTPILLAVRSFRINVAQEALVDLRRRVAATRWPGRSWREGEGGHTLCPPSPPPHGTRDLAVNCV